MPWHAQLRLDYQRSGPRTVGRFVHDGPLRVLKSLYPEDPQICHQVLVHPPGGLVGGDTLDIQVHAHTGSHALVTTPGATRFYRSNGQLAQQITRLQVDDGARLEWLPLEALAYNACEARNHLELQIAPGGECMGWDITALGLPHAQQPFLTGRLAQHLEVPGIWLERGILDAQDQRLMDGPLGLAGHRCMGSLFFVAGSPLARERREQGLEQTQGLLDQHPSGTWCGVTSPNPQVIVLRGLTPVVEPMMQLWQQVWALWRQHFWGLRAERPRIWSM